MAKVSPGPSVHFDYKKENPVVENDTSSTNNNWCSKIQSVAVAVPDFPVYNQNVRTGPRGN